MTLEDAAIAAQSRTNQSEEEIENVRRRIERMLAETTRAVVHIDDIKVDRLRGWTDFVLSDDSRFDRYATAIRAHVADHFDPNIYEIYENSTYIKRHIAGFPVAHSELATTLVIRVHAVLITYTALRYWLRKSWSVALLFAIILCAYIDFFMVYYQMRYI